MVDFARVCSRKEDLIKKGIATVSLNGIKGSAPSSRKEDLIKKGIATFKNRRYFTTFACS